MCFGGGRGGDNGAAQAAAAENARKQAIRQGTEKIDAAFAGFDDPFYDNIRQSYIDYATPKLETDYRDAIKQMVYALERRGLASSTAAGTEQKRIESQYNRYKTDVVNAAEAQRKNTMADVEQTRLGLLNALSATEDPAAAGTSSLIAADRLSQAPAFDPVGTFVFSLSEGLANQVNQNSGRTNYPALSFGGSGGSGGSITYAT